jgi:pimeloyl-ACP methyl ester carboxylesterase
MQKLKIKNKAGENLDTWIEGRQDASETVVIAHGFGTNKHETNNFFDEIVASLTPHYRTVRFDFSGYGQSEGRARDFTYIKHAEDLGAVINYVKSNYAGQISLIAQSMGCFVSLSLQPAGIRKTIFLGIPNSNTDYIADRLQDRIRGKGGTVNEDAITIFPRSSGEVQEMGAAFWADLRSFDPLSALKKYLPKSDLLIVHSAQDEIVGDEYMAEFQSIPGINFVTIDGDHSFTNPKDLQVLLELISQFLSA